MKNRLQNQLFKNHDFHIDFSSIFNDFGTQRNIDFLILASTPCTFWEFLPTAFTIWSSSCFRWFFHRFFIDVCSQISLEFDQKSNQKKTYFLNRFFRFFSRFGTPSWSQVGASWRYVGLLGASWGSSWRSWAPPWFQDAPKAPPRASQTPVDVNFHRFWHDFLKHVGVFFI